MCSQWLSVNSSQLDTELKFTASIFTVLCPNFFHFCDTNFCTNHITLKHINLMFW